MKTQPPWHLLPFYIRKPCKLCKLPPELQQLFYNAIQQHTPLREIAATLTQLGYPTNINTTFKHKKHILKLIEKTTNQEITQLHYHILKTQYDTLKLARTKEELTHAVLTALQSLVSQDTFNQILALLEADTNGNDRPHQ
jgi:hypothetical protein